MAEAERVIWLVRHGKRLDFIDPSWMETAARPHDTPLAPDGDVQAREVGTRLAAEKLDHIVTSPFLRTMQTAHQIAEVLDRPVKIEAGLCEILFERWFPTDPQMPDAAALAGQFPRIDSRFPSLVQPSYPEDEESFARRAAATAREVPEAYEGNLLLVGHGGSITGIVNALVGEKTSVHTCFCCLIKLTRHDGSWRVDADGTDTSHLSITESEIRLA